MKCIAPSISLALTLCQPNGAEKVENVLGQANEYEQKLLKTAIDGLKGNISKGVEFVQNPPPPPQK